MFGRKRRREEKKLRIQKRLQEIDEEWKTRFTAFHKILTDPSSDPLNVMMVISDWSNWRAHSAMEQGTLMAGYEADHTGPGGMIAYYRRMMKCE